VFVYEGETWSCMHRQQEGNFAGGQDLC